jgi:hypothetical protein
MTDKELIEFIEKSGKSERVKKILIAIVENALTIDELSQLMIKILIAIVENALTIDELSQLMILECKIERKRKTKGN